jgi:60 kDa SS-A/Ro ribonucleoprotein
VLVALNTYKAGKGIRGSAEWPVVRKLVDALEAAFEMAFTAVEPAGKRFVLGLDVSGSM